MTRLQNRTARLREAVVPGWLTNAMPDWLTEAVRPKPAPVPWGAMVRAALAICVPLSVGIAVGRRDVGLLPAIGGLLGTVLDTGGPYLARVKRVVTAAVFGGAAGLLIGMLIHDRGWVAVGVLVVVAGVSALISRLGSTGSATGLQLLVYSSLGLGPFGALRPWWHVLLGFFIGVGWALLLLVPSWLLSPRCAEQHDLAAVYHALASHLRAIGTPHEPEARRAVTAALNTAYDTLLTSRTTAGGRSRRMMHLIAVLNASHQVSEAATTLREEGARPPPLVADTLDRLADAIAAGRPLRDRQNPGRTALESLLSSTQHWADQHGLGWHWPGQDGDRAHADGARSAGQRNAGPAQGVPSIPPPWSASPGSLELRDALAALARTIAWAPATPAESAPQAPLRERARDRFGTVLDQLRGGWLAWSFTIRLMVCVGVAGVASEVLPLQRSYWVALTVAIVLKPDYGSVFARALQRGIGTIVGAVLGAAILAVVPYGPWLLLPMALLAAGLPYGRSRNFGLLATFLTPLIVLLIDLLTPVGWRLAGERMADTLLGCVIVLLIGYAPWPNSWHSHLPQQFATTVCQIARYMRAGLILPPVPAGGAAATTPAVGGSKQGGGTQPGDSQSANLPGVASRWQLRRAASRALGDLREEYQRAMSEPSAVGRRASAWWPAIVGLEEVIDAVTAAAVAISRGAPAPSPGAVRQLAAVLDAVADAIDAGMPPRIGELPGDQAFKPVTEAVKAALSVLRPGPQPTRPGAAVSLARGRYGLIGRAFAVRACRFGLARVQTRDPAELPADLGGTALGRLGELRDPFRGLLPGRLGEFGGLGAGAACGPLHRGVFHHLPGRFHHLFVALAAGSGTDDIADGKPRKERDAVPHLALLSPSFVMCIHDLPQVRRGYSSRPGQG